MLRKLVSSFKRLLGSRRFHSLSDQKTLAGKVLVAYLPLRQQGWILDFLWKDLCKQLKLIAGVEVGIAVSPEDLSRRSAGKDIFVVAMGLKQLNELIDMGFPPCRIIFYHTHVRLGHAIKKLDLVHAVLVLNGFERELIAMRKVDRNRIHLFPAGYDHLLFKHSNAEIGRPIDVLFVGRYRQGKDGYYHQRKRYGFQVELANRLLENGLNIAFLGGEWSQCEYDLSSRVKIIEVAHGDYPGVYQQARLVCSVAGQEGGPVSFLEGMASGCLMVSAPTGFVTDLKLPEVACWTLPLVESSKSWADSICQILNENPGPDADQCLRREDYLKATKFSELALQLVKICWPYD